MKPVNLLPGDAPVVAAAPGKPNMAALGGAVGGVVAIVAIAGYFAMARVDSVKAETQLLNTRAAEATAQTAATKSQVASLGQPVVDSDRQLADGAEQVLVSAFAERHDFVQLADELRGITQGTGGWLESFTATAAGATIEGNNAGGDSTQSVTLVGYMPTEQLAATFDERIDGTRTMHNATYVSLKSETRVDRFTKRPGTYWKFTITADLIDTIAPAMDGASTGADGGALVSDGAAEGALTLSLDPEPKPAKAAPAKPAKPRNPFDVAASNAARGGGA